jgi:hypothetical protein
MLALPRTKEEAVALVERLQAKDGLIKRMREKGAETAGVVIDTVATVGAAGAMGYARVAMADDEGEFALMGVDYELLLGGGLHLAAMTGAFGKYDATVQAVANGCLAAWATQTMAAVAAESEDAPVTTEGRRRRSPYR